MGKEAKPSVGAVRKLAAAEQAHRRMGDFKDDAERRVVWRGQCVKLLLAALGEGPSMGAEEQQKWQAMGAQEKAALAASSRAELEDRQPGSVRVAQGLLAALRSQQAADSEASEAAGPGGAGLAMAKAGKGQP